MTQHTRLDVDATFLADIPGYRAILKTVLKSQILILVDQLAQETGEESLILTACIGDRTFSQLGSSHGKDFLNGKDEIKTQFLHHCLKKQKQQTGSDPVVTIKDDSSESDEPIEDNKINCKKHNSGSKRKRCFSNVGGHSVSNNCNEPKTLHAANKKQQGAAIKSKKDLKKNVEKYKIKNTGKDMLADDNSEHEPGVIVVKEEVGDNHYNKKERYVPVKSPSNTCTDLVVDDLSHSARSKGQMVMLNEEQSVNVDVSENSETDDDIQHASIEELTDISAETGRCLGNRGHGITKGSAVLYNTGESLRTVQSTSSNHCVEDGPEANTFGNQGSFGVSIANNPVAVQGQEDLNADHRFRNLPDEPQLSTYVPSVPKKAKSGREFITGQALDVDLRTNIVLEVIKNGGDIGTGHVPRGTYSKVRKSLGVCHATVSKIWERYVIDGTIATRHTNNK